MNIDIRTLAIVLGITNLLQVIAIFRSSGRTVLLSMPAWKVSGWRYVGGYLRSIQC